MRMDERLYMNTKYSLERPPANTPAFYATDDGTDPYERTVFAHYFIGNSEWYVLEYSPLEDSFFGWSEILPDMGELGYTSMNELENAVIYGQIIFGGETSSFPIRVSYDTHWQPRSLNECLKLRR
jgi:hypothetical protein